MNFYVRIAENGLISKASCLNTDQGLNLSCPECNGKKTLLKFWETFLPCPGKAKLLHVRPNPAILPAAQIVHGKLHATKSGAIKV